MLSRRSATAFPQGNVAAQALSWSGEAIDKIYDEVAATPHDQLGLVTREPVGVVGAIVPWNFPLMMACWKLGPALSTGNSVILKPSEKSPLTAIRIAALAVEAGIPKGVFNVLPGYGHTVGNALALHMDVDTLVFTGSTKIAKQLLIRSGESNMKRVWLEAGGKSPNIVFPMPRTCKPPPNPRLAPSPSTRAKCAPPVRACWWSVRSRINSCRW
jgi:4-guanidinobutyraldehyde dehydrogenase/NAD-dependent aldehyde dehydrogenase